MASESAVASYSVGQISQVLSTSRKRKQTDEENIGLQSLFSTSFSQQPVFIQVKEKKKKKKLADDKEKEGKPRKKKKKKASLSDLNEQNEASGDDSDENDDESDKKTKLKYKKSLEDPERLKRTIFVGNIPVTLKKKALKKLFDKYGEVESVRFRSAALAKPSMSRSVGMKRKEFHKDRHALNGYVVFEEQTAAVDALQCNGQEVEGMHIRVDLANNDKVHDHSKSVFVGNLPFGTEEEPLRELFKDCGEIRSIRLIRDNKTGVGKGFGFITFRNKDAVGFAIKINQTPFKGRPIRVFPSSENPQKGRNFKVKKGRPQTHSFSGLQAKKNIKLNNLKPVKRKESTGNNKKGKKKRAGKNVGQSSKRSLAYKEKLNKKRKT